MYCLSLQPILGKSRTIGLNIVSSLPQLQQTAYSPPQAINPQTYQTNFVDSGVFVMMFMHLLQCGIPIDHWPHYCQQDEMNVLRREATLSLLEKRTMKVMRL